MRKAEKILQLKITLKGIKPAIWRRFLVKDSISFEQLHNMIQKIMSWENYHMSEFQIGDEIITSDEKNSFNAAESCMHTVIKSPEFHKMVYHLNLSKSQASLDVKRLNKILRNAEKNIPKNRFDMNSATNLLLKTEGQKFRYLYDFGDCWEHELIIERIFKPEEGKEYPVCIGGERSCPPEDCGGIHGYHDLMMIRRNKKHPEYKAMIKEWLGEDYDPELFIADWVNAYLHGKKPKAVWVMKK